MVLTTIDGRAANQALKGWDDARSTIIKSTWQQIFFTRGA